MKDLYAAENNKLCLCNALLVREMICQYYIDLL